MRPPFDFVVIGAQRGGSTQLSASLRSHPRVFLPADEIPYFEDPFFVHSPRSALDDVFAGADDALRWGIHCPSYLARPEVAARVHCFAPDARILVVLRDPVARAVSAYFWYVQFGMLPLEPVGVGLERLLDGWSDKAYPQAWEVLDWSFYGRHLARYVELFGREQIIPVLNEELGASGGTGVRRLYERLEIDRDHEPTGVVRRNEGVYDLRRLRVLRTRGRLAWSWSETTTFSYRRRRLRHPLRFLPNAAIVGLDRLVLRRLFGGHPPDLPLGLEARLQELYAPDVVALESLLGLDLSSWRAPSVGERPPPEEHQAAPRPS